MLEGGQHFYMYVCILLQLVQQKHMGDTRMIGEWEKITFMPL